jgi:chromosome segregation ATPase
MAIPMGNELSEAEARLDGLRHERADIENRLGEAIQDGDAELMIRLERRAATIEVELFAARAKVLKLRRAEVEGLRREAITQREAIEAELSEATRQYADAISVADEKRVAMQTVQVKNYSLQQRIDQLREDFNALNNKLKTLVSNRIGRRYEGEIKDHERI